MRILKVLQKQMCGFVFYFVFIFLFIDFRTFENTLLLQKFASPLLCLIESFKGCQKYIYKLKNLH